MKNISALVLHEYGSTPVLEKINIPELEHNTVLIKVQATTVNPSDNLFINGTYFPKQLPALLDCKEQESQCLFDAQVVEANGEEVQKYLNKRVVFRTSIGSWAEYSVSKLGYFFEISEDVPLSSAASGIINPLTVIGFISQYKKNGYTGIIHTAAASALGRMLNKLCITLGIPLLNVVRRQQQASILRSEGALNVLVTQGNWVPQYQEFIAKLHLNVLFDAIAGGPISQQLVANLKLPSTVYFYGWLSGEQVVIKNPTNFLGGLNLKGFLLSSWFPAISQQQKDQIAKNYGHYLKTDLSTNTYKTLTFKQVEDALHSSRHQSTKGKILLIPQ